MVYCGKPSKGCGHCRSRKIRCDQARPACSQCVRAKRDCPGYRDQLSLMFRDESSSVVRKANADTKPETRKSSSPPETRALSRPKQSAARTRRKASPDGNPESAPTVEVGPDLFLDFNADPLQQFTLLNFTNLPMEVQPSAPNQDDAICYFMRTNAFPGAFWMVDFMEKFLLQPGGTQSTKAMRASMAAVASAMLCRVRKVTALKEIARKEYCSALELLNSALVSVEEAKSNQALGAVVLLAIYEIVTSRAPQDIDSWTNHIRGATALLEMRGPEQLNTEAGLRLFLHLRYQIVVSCMQRDARVPDSLLENTRTVLKLRPNEAHSNRLVIIVGRLSNLRADIISGVITDDQQIISMASAIEAELISWLAALPAGFTYETHTKSRFDYGFQERCRGLAPYEDQYHVYPDLWAFNTWNQYRCARILASEIILTHIRQMSDSSSLKSMSEEFQLHCKTLRANIRRLAVDICRSVPYALGVHKPEFDPTLPPPDSYLGGMVLLWPLYMAGTAENATHPLRRWVVQCLRMVGFTYGLDQALALMDIVAADPGILHSVTDAELDQGRITEVPTSNMSTSRTAVEQAKGYQNSFPGSIVEL
ncbi:hypothetical protein N7478_012401 [Penicillium angulare]|uniref:uncharacterized protein n=1 Tax=Penicillium angulare TaxID=116970 RepID=UPI002541F02A|nr:uncharacterized protein N7478_012401 [Penicillium angulare]KAJ5259420.1 hypothetical protein N7478_012401 [Penicillium angulare]